MNEFELKFLRMLREASTPFFDTLMEIITFLGEEYVLVIIMALIYLCYNKKLGQRLTFTIFSSLALNNTIKGFVQRPRPWVVDPDLASLRVETATGFSFPSGHTQNGSTLFTATALVFEKKWMLINALIISVLIGYSRLHLGVHYPSDVIVGLILGIGVAFLCDKLHRKFEDSYQHQLKLYLIMLVAFIPLLIVFYFFAQNRNTGNFYEAVKPFRDYYLAYALFSGFTLGSFLENKYVDFDCECSAKIKILRFVIAGIIVGLIMVGLKYLLPKHLLCDMFRYFMITFVGLGLFPIVCKNWLFKKKTTN